MRRRRPTIKASYSLLPTLVAGRLPLVFGLSGAYLGNPDWFQNAADWIDPPTDADAGERLIDQVLYWLAYLHFGRINGIGIPCHGPGLCDQATKATWALLGLSPAAMFLTGAIMWWNRVLRSRVRAWLRASAQPRESELT